MSAGGEWYNDDVLLSNGATIAYRWCRSRRRTLGITVRRDLSVSVRVPLRTSPVEVRDFVIRKGDWISSVLTRIETRLPRSGQRFEPGALVPFLGRDYPLVFEQGHPPRLQLDGERLLLTAPQLPPDAELRRMIDGWYREQARAAVEERSLACHRLMQAEGIPLPPITIRPMQSRWGSYSYRTGRISLNLNLIRAPLDCLDYVIIHELCHIRLRHHGPEFWRLVARYQPDFQALRSKLRQYV